MSKKMEVRMSGNPGIKGLGYRGIGKSGIIYPDILITKLPTPGYPDVRMYYSKKDE